MEKPEPKFSELTKVKIICERFGAGDVGYVLKWHYQDNRWLYKICLGLEGGSTYDNWIPEECLELTI